MAEEAPPHHYVPAGPLESRPGGGFQPAGVRREAFAAALDGVPLGAYDRRIIEWLVQLDDDTCRALASLMWRCRLTAPREPGTVTEWGVRCTYDGKTGTETFQDEEEARQAAADTADISDDGTAALLHREVGPWKEAGGA